MLSTEAGLDDMHHQAEGGSEVVERRLEFDDCQLAGVVFGPHGAHLKLLEELSGVRAFSRGSSLVLRPADPGAPDVTEPLDAAAGLVNQLYGLARGGRPISTQDVEHGWRVLSVEPGVELKTLFEDLSVAVSRRKRIAPRSVNQRRYLDAVRDHDLTFGIGPAGTGKTYLAVALAVAALNAKQVKRLVLTRPAVEAGERLGFLPGDLVEKVNPYLRPLYDALHDMLEFGKVQEMLEAGVIEVAPLAFMRGRTLNDAFVILDEAQNTTPEQMKMFLTRLGFGSKAVVTGDVTQIDLPMRAPSGLVHASKVLAGVAGIAMVEFTERDVIRHPLVGRIVNAYERHEQED